MVPKWRSYIIDRSHRLTSLILVLVAFLAERQEKKAAK